MFDSVKEVLCKACEENGNTPMQEVVSAIGITALIPMLWIALYMLGAR
uniref:Uncharacterized protein n=1 Tax=Siphoviridae sp. ctt1f11 TaxID=2827959 RepID=A0A8S5SDC0_9CAUD|nr:MAG TPA: hypothetical protein [Siphoviridae sp. ctt1f11]